VVSQQATWQAWRVAFYLESRRWLNSVVRTLQNPIGLLTTILALLIAAALVWAFFPQAYWIQPNDPSQRIWQETSSQERLQRRPSPTLWEGLEVIPIASAYLTKTRVDENPLLKVPPACRGNRWAWFPSRSGGNLKEGGICKLHLRDWYKGSLLHPIRDIDIRLAARLGSAIRRPHQHLAVAREHREAVKIARVGNPFDALPIKVD
jgi:hypothetical protein